MRRFSAKLWRLAAAQVCLFAAIFPFATQVRATPPAFTLTPNTVGNTYVGFVTNVITGLGKGETVLVQKFLDANTNGVIDGGDILVGQYTITDGQATVIGGVTNTSVPGDTDGHVNGQVTALFPFLPIYDTSGVGTPLGQYLVKVSGTNGSATNLFKVTNSVFSPYLTVVVTNGATISGAVTNNGTSVPYAIVVVGAGSLSGNGSFSPQAATVANASGFFSIKVPAGAYTLLPVKSNFLASAFSLPTVTVTNGGSVSNDVGLITATESISGVVVDSTNSSLGLGGVPVIAESTNGGLAIGFTSSNGAFNLGVNPSGQWQLQIKDNLPGGYFGQQNKLQVNTLSGSVANLTNQVIHEVGMFYGAIRDSQGNPLPGLEIMCNDTNNTYESKGRTDPSGNYFAGTLPGDWLCPLDVDLYDTGETVMTNYVYSFGLSNYQQYAAFSGPQAVAQNFTAIRATNRITGNLQDNNGALLSGVGMVATSMFNGINYLTEIVDTDTNGNYSLNVPNGTWAVDVYCYGNYFQSSDDSLNNGNYGNSNYICPNITNVIVAGANVSGVNFVVSTNNNSGGTDQIFGNLTNIVTGAGIANITITATDPDNNQFFATTSDSGFYSFNLTNNPLIISVNCSQLNSAGYNCVSSGNAFVCCGNSEEVDFGATPMCSGTLAISTSGSLPGCDVGEIYDNGGDQLANTGCNPPYTWSVATGSLPMPAGLFLSTNGIISGTPTNSAIGTNYFNVQVQDSVGNTAVQTMEIIASPMLVITNSNLPNGAMGVFYSLKLGAAGGPGGGSFGWNVSSGALPPGLNPDLGGLISGTPTAAGTYDFTISTLDNNGATASKTLSITITGNSVQITTTTLPNTGQGLGFANQLQAISAATPFTWSIATGSQGMPAGLGLSSGGLISGIPTTNGAFGFIVKVTDTNNSSAQQSLTLIIGPLPGMGSSGKSFGSPFTALLTNSLAGHTYKVQYSTDLVDWLLLFSTNASGSSFQISDTASTNSCRFYRTAVGP